jgi:hypothetical protein
MIWEAVLWWVFSVARLVEAPVEWLIPEAALAAYRDAVTTYGVTTVAALSRFASRDALAFFAFALSTAVSLSITAIIMGIVRAVRSWLP